MLFVAVGILIFGALIGIHEFGHFITAKAFGVKVNEFSIGMGPSVFKCQKGETLYSLRLFPVGGYCAMEGEDEESQDPRAFDRAALWKKLIILAAGAFMNFVMGLVILFVLYLPAGGFYHEVYSGPIEGYNTQDCGLVEGDRLLSVDGHRVLVNGNAQRYLSQAGDTLDFVVERNGQRLELKDVHLPYQIRTDEEGNTTRLRGIYVSTEVIPADMGDKVVRSWNSALDFVRLVWDSLGQLVSGAVGLRDMSGPVGIVDTMTEVGTQSESVWDGLYRVFYLGALIAVNLAVMNLLPLPALDGGRIFFLIINGGLYGLFRKKIPAEYEGFVHMAGLALLLTLMVAVTMSDVGKLFGR